MQRPEHSSVQSILSFQLWTEQVPYLLSHLSSPCVNHLLDSVVVTKDCRLYWNLLGDKAMSVKGSLDWAH